MSETPNNTPRSQQRLKLTPQNIGVWLMGQPVAVTVPPMTLRGIDGDLGDRFTADVCGMQHNDKGETLLVVRITDAGVPRVRTITLPEWEVEAVLPPGAHRDPDTGVLTSTDEGDVRFESGLTLDSLVYEALGAASMCWSSIRTGGVFDSIRASKIGAELVDRIRALDPEQLGIQLGTLELRDDSDVTARLHALIEANKSGAPDTMEAAQKFYEFLIGGRLDEAVTEAGFDLPPQTFSDTPDGDELAAEYIEKFLAGRTLSRPVAVRIIAAVSARQVR